MKRSEFGVVTSCLACLSKIVPPKVRGKTQSSKWTDEDNRCTDFETMCCHQAAIDTIENNAAFGYMQPRKKKGNIQKARRKKANATGNRRKRGNAKNELFEGRKTTTTRRKNKKNMIIEKFHSFWRQRTILWEIIAHPTAPPSAKRKTKTCTATSAGPIITPVYPSKSQHFWERQRKRKKKRRKE